MTWAEIVADARKGKGPLRQARRLLKAMLRVRLPVIRPIHGALYGTLDIFHELWPIALKILYREPLLRYRCEQVGRGLHLEGAIPQIFGSGRIAIGDDVRIGGRNTWTIGYKMSTGAEFIVGNRVNIGYQTQVSVAIRVTIGDDTIMAPNVQIYDNINHPISPGARLRRESFSLEDAAPVAIGRNVWIGSNAMIMRGVTIGDGSIVGAASVVTRDVAPDTLVAGNPAREIRSIAD